MTVYYNTDTIFELRTLIEKPDPQPAPQPQRRCSCPVIVEDEMIGIIQPAIAAEIGELPQALIGIIRIVEHVAVDDQVVAGPVGYQNVAVAVENLTPGSRNGGTIGVGADGAVGIGGIDHLHRIGTEAVKPDQQRHKGQKYPEAKFDYAFHVLPPTR